VADEPEGTVPRHDGADHSDGFSDEKAEFTTGRRLHHHLEGERVSELGIELENAGRAGCRVLGQRVKDSRLARPHLGRFVAP
jgi:hypothetical protein